MRFESLQQRELRPIRAKSPCFLAHQCRRGDIELYMPVKSLAIQHDLAVLPDIEPKVHALINGKPRHQPVLVIHMRAQRADAVGGEDVKLHEGLRFLHFGKYLPFLAKITIKQGTIPPAGFLSRNPHAGRMGTFYTYNLELCKVTKKK